MLKGDILGDNKESILALYAETEKERIVGANNLSLDNKVLAFLYCCPSYVQFRGCDDKSIDIAFLSRKGNKFLVRKIISGFMPSEICAMNDVELVIESDVGNFNKWGIRVGQGIQLRIEHNGSLRDISSFYESKENAAHEFADVLKQHFGQFGMKEENIVSFLGDLITQSEKKFKEDKHE